MTNALRVPGYNEDQHLAQEDVSQNYGEGNEFPPEYLLHAQSPVVV